MIPLTTAHAVATAVTAVGIMAIMTVATTIVSATPSARTGGHTPGTARYSDANMPKHNATGWNHANDSSEGATTRHVNTAARRSKDSAPIGSITAPSAHGPGKSIDATDDGLPPVKRRLRLGPPPRTSGICSVIVACNTPKA